MLKHNIDNYLIRVIIKGRSETPNFDGSWCRLLDGTTSRLPVSRYRQPWRNMDNFVYHTLPA